MRPIRLLPLLSCLLLFACSSAGDKPTDNAVDSSGWRRGLVVQVGDAASFGPIEGGDCRHRGEAASPVEDRYVEVRYFVGRHAHLRIVPLVEGAQVVAGDAVYFKPGSCVDAVVRSR